MNKKIYKEIKTLLLLYLWLNCIRYVCSQETENPTDISRDEGEEAVRIPCELVFSSIQNRMIFWRINGIDYTINNLPSIYTQTLSGLRIERVTLAMNGTSFQCLLPTDNDLAVQASSIGVLTVIPQTGNGDHTVPDLGTNYVEIDHQNLNFGNDSVTLAWKLNALNESTSLETCDMISITSTDPRGTTAPSEIPLSSDVRNVTLPSDLFYSNVGEPTLVNISLVDEFQRVCLGFTLHQHVRFNIDRIEIVQVRLESGDCINNYCIDIASSSFILAIPGIPNVPRDIYCPVYIESGNDCYNHNRCNGFNEAFSWPFFSICRSSFNRSSFQMCFNNISEAQDGIKLFFIIAKYRNNLVTFSSNLYVRAMEIHVEACSDGPIQEPSFFTATEGVSGLLIQCTACESETRIPSWRLNGSDFFNFDNQSFLFSGPNSLVIADVFQSMNGITIQCSLPAQYGLPMLISCEKMFNVEIAFEEEFFQLDHQNLSFDGDNVTLVWRGFYNENCSSSYIQILIQPMCNNNYSVNSNGSSLTLPLYAPTQDQLKFYLSVQYYEQCPNSMSEEVKVTFSFDRIETVSVPFGYSDCSCIYVRNSIILIISSTPKDILIPIHLEDGDCVNFKQYFNGFNANYPFLSLCRDSTITTNVNLRMCFGNVTNDLDGIKLYTTTYTSVCSLMNIQFIKNYTKGVEIRLQANVSLNNSNQVCIIPPAMTCGSNPVNDVFSVSVTDISGYSVFNGSVVVDTCETMTTLQKPYCAPYEITIGVMESFLQVPQGNNLESDLCRCVKENINTTFKAMITRSRKLRLQYYCNTPYISVPDDIVVFELNVQSATSPTEWSRCEDGHFDIDISCKFNTNLSLTVITNLGRGCFLNKTLTIMCPEPTSDLRLLALLVLLIPLVIIIIIFVIVLIRKVCCKPHQGEEEDLDERPDGPVQYHPGEEPEVNIPGHPPVKNQD